MPVSDAKRPNLDGPPPQAPGMTRRVVEPPMSSMMGGAPPISSATMPQAVIEKAMLVENSLTALARLAPTLTPIVAQMIDALRMNVAQAIQGSQQPMGMELASPAPAAASPGAGMPMA